jgi:hypothetical protein
MRNLLYVILSACCLFFFGGPVAGAPYQESDTFTEDQPLIFMDFDDNESEVNNIGGTWGAFDADPNDTEAYVRTTFWKDQDLHKKGYNLKVDYSVQSSLPAFNGIWFKLNRCSLKDFQAVSITIKGDADKGFNTFFKVEFKDMNNKISGMIENISSEWNKIVLPFHLFETGKKKIDMGKATEFTIVFEDWRFKEKIGEYFIDDISFIPKKGVVVKFSDMMSGSTNTTGPKKKKIKDPDAPLRK